MTCICYPFGHVIDLGSQQLVLKQELIQQSESDNNLATTNSQFNLTKKKLTITSELEELLKQNHLGKELMVRLCTI